MVSRSSLAARWSHRKQPRPGVDILVVCTGNICRSPYVAHALQLACPDLRIASAGTAALVGEEPAELVLTALTRLGLPDPPRARQLRRAMVRNATLVVTMTHAQRAEVLRLLPAANDRTFTLKELARTAADGSAGDDTAKNLAALIDQANADVHAASPELHDDLADPYGGPPQEYAMMMREADVAVALIATRLNGGAPE